MRSLGDPARGIGGGAAMSEPREYRAAIYWLLRAYQSGYHEGWEPGPSTKETLEGMWNWLCNHGYDPASAHARKLLRQKRVPR